MRGFSFFNKNITAIDLGSYETKIIEGRQERDSIAVKKAFSFITPPDAYDNGYIRDEAKLADAAKEELRKHNISGSTCHIAVKSTAVLIREIQFPNLGSKEIEGLLNYQLAEYLPMDFSKYVIQHKAIERLEDSGKEKLNVLVVAVPREMVDMHYSFVRALGLKAEVMDYQSNGLWKFLKYAGSINGGLLTSERTVAAIDLGYSSSNVTIISRGNAKLSRVIDSGGFNLDRNISNLVSMGSEELLTYKQGIADVSVVEEGYSDRNRYTNIVKTSIEGIMDKLDKVFKYYASKEPENKIEALLLYGGLSRIKGIEKLFGGYFNIPSAVLENTDKIYLAGDVNKYAGCVGALIRDAGV